MGYFPRSLDFSFVSYFSSFISFQLLLVFIDPRLVVEQTGVLLDKGDAQLLGRLKDCVVVLAAAGGGDVLYA